MFKSKKIKKCLLIITSILLLAAIGAGIFFGVTSHQMNQIPAMSFTQMLNYTAEKKEDAVITVGIVQNNELRYTVYGENGKTLAPTDHTYEIGSITKTITATMIYKAIDEKKIELDAQIDAYLDLPQKEYYPTIKRLLTHTSGYKGYYFESVMVSNFFTGKNDFCGISKEKLRKRIGKVNLKNKEYAYEYSNFGFAVLGLVLCEIYDTDYTPLVNAFVQQELGLTNTKISDGTGDLGQYWDWQENDAYLSAGGLTSTITDMLQYARLQLSAAPSFITDTHNTLANISENSKRNEKMNVRVDSCGAAWIGDETNEIIWHNGGTGNYNAYIGFDKKTGWLSSYCLTLPRTIAFLPRSWA